MKALMEGSCQFLPDPLSASFARAERSSALRSRQNDFSAEDARPPPVSCECMGLQGQKSPIFTSVVYPFVSCHVGCSC